MPTIGLLGIGATTWEISLQGNSSAFTKGYIQTPYNECKFEPIEQLWLPDMAGQILPPWTLRLWMSWWTSNTQDNINAPYPWSNHSSWPMAEPAIFQASRK